MVRVIDLFISLGREENDEYIKEIANLTDKPEEIVRKRIKYGEIFHTQKIMYFWRFRWRKGT